MQLVDAVLPISFFLYSWIAIPGFLSFVKIDTLF